VGEPDWADPHRRAVAPAVVGPTTHGHGPPRKAAPVAGVRVVVEILLHLLRVVRAGEDRVGDGHRQDGVVRGVAESVEEGLEVRRLDVPPLVHRADDVAGDGPEHRYNPYLAGSS